MFNFTSILKNTSLAVALALPTVALGQSVGDFRSNGAVTFAAATNWQRYDGTAWVAAAAAPTSADGAILIMGPHTAQVTSNVTLDQLSVDGILQVNNGFTLTLNDGAGDDLFVRNRLFFEATGVITGAGQLVLGNQAIVQTANVGGLSASITSTNPTLTAGASYWFNGTTAQSTGFTGFASLGNPLHFHFKNTAGITIDRNLTITGTLTANKNVPITIGAGVISFTANAIYNGGSFNNCVGATITPAFTNSAWASPKGVYQSPDSSEPTTEASNIWTNSHKTTAHIYWLQSGSGNNRIVVLKAGSAVSPTAAVDNTTYTANAAFGSGTAIDGGFVVYNGAGSQVNVTGLTEGTTYHVAVFEYNQDCSGNRNYKIGTPLTTSFVAEERPFITEWITTDGTLTIPTFTGTPTETYNYNISYRILPAGAVTTLTGQTGNVTLNSLTNGVTYEVSITGTFPRIYFGESPTENKAKIRNIKQWGSVQWTSMENAFGFPTLGGCSNLNSNAADIPNLSNVSNMSYMFHNCLNFNGGNIGNWNTSNVTNMQGMFLNCIVDQPIGMWNTSNVTNMQDMFNNATSFNQPIGTWNTSNVTNMFQMFREAYFFNQPIGMWNTGNVTNMSNMFREMFSAFAFNQSIGTWNTANVTDMSSMFRETATFNQSLANWNITSVTNMAAMLSDCGISTANYDATLIGWAVQPVQTGVSFSCSSTYCAGAAARSSLINSKGWIINDAGSGDCINTSVSTLSAFSSCSGAASVAQSYTVSGSNLTTDIVITAPPDFEVSVTSATAGFANSQTLTQSGGNVGSTTVYIRQIATAPNGASGTVTHTSTGMLTKNVSIPVSAVTTACVTSSNPIAGGIDTRITINGSGFTAGSVVTVGGVAVRRLWYYSPSQIVVQVGNATPLATNTVVVSGATSPNNFTRIDCADPTGVTATTQNGTHSGITVNWTNPSTVNRVDVLYRITGSTLPATEFSRVTTGMNTAGNQSFLLTGLQDNQNYDVFVQIRCDGSTWSNWVSAGTVASGTGATCTRPTISSPANNSTLAALQANLTWSAVTNATNYQVFTVEVDAASPVGVPVGGTSQVLTVTGTATTVHFPKANTKYRVWVRANCGTTGLGEYNDNFYIRTGAVTSCLPPNTFPAVSYAAGAANLANATMSWSGASGASGSPQYMVHFMLPDGTIHSRSSNTTSMTWAGLNGNQTYQYRVQTFCANGNASAFSAWQSFTVPATYGSCSGNVTGINSSNVTSWGARLDWTPAATNNAPESNGRTYWVQYWNVLDPNTIYTLPKDSSKVQLLVGVHQGLAAGQQYGCRVWYLCNGTLQSYFNGANFQLLSVMADKTPSSPATITVESELGLTIYPNPAKQVAVISYQSAVSSKQPIELVVVDALGREVYRETSQAQNLRTNLNVSNLAAGVYLVKVQDGEQTATKRLVVE